MSGRRCLLVGWTGTGLVLFLFAVVALALTGARASRGVSDWDEVSARLLTPDQRHAIRAGALVVELRAEPGAGVAVGVATGSGRARLALVSGAVARIGDGGVSRVVLPLSPSGSRALRGCARLRALVMAGLRSRGDRRALPLRSSRVLAPDRSQCRPSRRARPGRQRRPGSGHLPVPPSPAVGPDGVRTLAGAAERSITPPGPGYVTHVGGYGDCKGCDRSGGTTEVNPGDGLRVRALVVRRGEHAVVLATADLEGWFAGYKQGSGLGLLDLRRQVAAELSRPVRHGGQGLRVGPEDVIVSSVHCHACPTVVGIWGKTNVRYLRFVYDQMRLAIEDAAAHARPAALEWARADMGYVNGVTLGISNANEGWPIDAQLSILRATAAASGRTIATYANVPVHGNIVHGPDSHEMSSEYFGAADRWLEHRLGGIAVVGPGTLGDQTTPMQSTPPDRALAVDARLGALVGSTIQTALSAHPHPITDPTLGGAEQYLVVPFTNPALSGSDCQASITQIVGIEVDRSCDPPYAYNVTGLGVWFTTLRIGSIAVASEPGEAFPHVSFAVRRVLSGAQAVFTAGQAQDQLGYYYEPFAFPTTFVYSADHNIFHASMALAEANAQVQIANGSKLGFSVTPSAIDPTGNDFTRVLHPGVQTWAYPQADGSPAPAGETVWIGVYRAPARCSALPACSPDPGPATVTFGDGSPTTRVSTAPGGSPYASELEHTFPRPGDYQLTATLSSGESWTSTVHIVSPWVVTNTPHYPRPGTVFDSPGQAGR